MSDEARVEMSLYIVGYARRHGCALIRFSGDALDHWCRGHGFPLPSRVISVSRPIATAATPHEHPPASNQ